MQGEVGIPLELKQGMGPHLHVRWETRGSSRIVAGNKGFHLRCDGDLWTRFNCMKRVKPHLKIGEGTRECSLGAERTNGLMSRRRGNLLVFLELQQWDSSPANLWNSGSLTCCLREVKSPCELRGASQDSFSVSAGSWVFIRS